jgi:hypothetical protein
MDKSDIIRHAINISKFMRAASDFLNQGQWPDEQQMPGRRYQTVDEFHNRHDEFGDPINLGDLGLDDMSLSRVVVELSQTRDHFKIWTPFKDSFRKAIKSCMPPDARRWDPDEDCWRVDCYWFGNAQEVISEHFPHLERRYTDRAIRMCEQLAREDEEEEAAEQRKRQARSRKKKKKSKSRAHARYTSGKKKKQKAPPPPPEDDYEEWEPEPPAPSGVDKAYETLGVSRNAEKEVIKAAHKALARKYHTDATGKDSDAKMKEVNAAFETIKEHRGWTTK